MKKEKFDIDIIAKKGKWVDESLYMEIIEAQQKLIKDLVEYINKLCEHLEINK